MLSLRRPEQTTYSSTCLDSSLLHRKFVIRRQTLFSVYLDATNADPFGGSYYLAYLVGIAHHSPTGFHLDCFISIFKRVWKACQRRLQRFPATGPGNQLFAIAGLAGCVQQVNYQVHVVVPLLMREQVTIHRRKHKPAPNIQNHSHIELKAIRSEGSGALAKRERFFRGYYAMNLLGILPCSESIDESLSLRTRGAYFELYCLQLRAPLYQTTTVDEDESYCPRTGTVVRLSTVGEGLIQATTELGRSQSWIVGLRNTESHVTKLVAILAIQIENNRHDKTLSASRGHAICEKHSWQIWPAGKLMI